MSLLNRISQAGSSIRSGLSGAWSRITDGVSALTGRISTGLTGLINGTTLVGISVANIPNMKDAVRTSMKNLEDILEGFNTTDGASNAFAGEYKEAIRRYIAVCAESTRAIVSNLGEINDKLDKVGTNYVIRDGVVAEAVDQTASQMNVERYQEENAGVQGWN